MYSSHLASSGRHVPFAALGLTPEATTLEGLFAAQPAETFAAGQAVFWEGDASTHVFQIVEGCLRLYRILPDGRRAVIGFTFGGEVLGVSFQGPYLYTAEAVTPVRLRRISRRRMIEMAASSSGMLRQQLMDKMYEEMSAAQHLIIVLGQLSAEERVANFLVSAAQRTGADRRKPVAVELPMSRLDIADYLGLTIETVCRVFSKLKREGLIALEGRHHVILRGIATLLDLAGEMDEERPCGIRIPARPEAALPN